MKKLLLLMVPVFLVIGVFTTVSNALPNSGIFMFTMDGNDSNTDPAVIEAEIDSWFGLNSIDHDPVDLDFYAKVDAPDLDVPSLSLTYESDMMSGTWNTVDAIEFYSVKGGRQFAFYWVEGGSTSGTWNTENLLNGGGNIPQISHFSAWNPIEIDDPPGPNPVPEPSTIILLGLGIIGLAGIRRKVRK